MELPCVFVHLTFIFRMSIPWVRSDTVMPCNIVFVGCRKLAPFDVPSVHAVIYQSSVLLNVKTVVLHLWCGEWATVFKFTSPRSLNNFFMWTVYFRWLSELRKRLRGWRPTSSKRFASVHCKKNCALVLLFDTHTRIDGKRYSCRTVRSFIPIISLLEKYLIVRFRFSIISLSINWVLH